MTGEVLYYNKNSHSHMVKSHDWLTQQLEHSHPVEARNDGTGSNSSRQHNLIKKKTPTQSKESSTSLEKKRTVKVNRNSGGGKRKEAGKTSNQQASRRSIQMSRMSSLYIHICNVSRIVPAHNPVLDVLGHVSNTEVSHVASSPTPVTSITSSSLTPLVSPLIHRIVLS